MNTVLVLLLFLLLLAIPLSARRKLQRSRILLVIPGIGKAKRLENVVLQLTKVFSVQLSTNPDINTRRDWDCISYIYADDDDDDFWVKSKKSVDELAILCELVRWPGGQYSMFLKATVPTLLRRYTHIFVVMDDIIFQTESNTFDLQGFFDIAGRNNLTVASPGITGSGLGFMYPSNNTHPEVEKRLAKRPMPAGTIGRIVNSVEIQATLFSFPSFRCFWSLLDLKRNYYGWYYDSYFYEFCREKVPGFKMGIVDSMEVYHGFGLGQTSSVHGNVKNQQATDMEAWWLKHRGIELKKIRRAAIGYIT